MARNKSRVHRSPKTDPIPIAMIRQTNAIRADVRLRWSHEMVAGRKLIRGRMETEPGDNSSISFRQSHSKIAQTALVLHSAY